MKAIVQDSYGSPDEVLQLRDIDKPVIGDDDVLVRVRAASVHPDDRTRSRSSPEASASNKRQPRAHPVSSR
jgi:NADPH:quinone reductase-like Zn-dependent oxidoreductase